MSWSKQQQQQQQKIWYFLSLQKLQTSTSHVSVTDITHALTHCTDSWLATHPQRMLIAGLEGELGSTGSGQLNAAVGLELVCAQTVWVWTVCARAYSHVFACQLIVHTASLACSSPVFAALDKRHFDVVPATLHAVFPQRHSSPLVPSPSFVAAWINLPSFREMLPAQPQVLTINLGLPEAQLLVPLVQIDHE